MRRVTEYLSTAEDSDRLASEATDASLKKRYEDMAACYRLLARERDWLIAERKKAP